MGTMLPNSKERWMVSSVLQKDIINTVMISSMMMRPYWPIQISVYSKSKNFPGCSVHVFALDQCPSSTNLYVHGSISLGDRTLQNLGTFPTKQLTYLNQTVLLSSTPHILSVSVIRRILSRLNAQHWQPCRELKELFDDIMDHVPERRSVFLQMKR